MFNHRLNKNRPMRIDSLMKGMPRSSIVFVTDGKMIDLLIGMEHQKARTVLLFDPGHPESVKVNPLFMADSATLDWIASFFYESPSISLSDDRGLFRDLLDIAINAPTQEATLPGIYAQAALGPEELKRLFSLRGRPEHVRFLSRFDRRSFPAQKEALDRIRRPLSFLKDSRIASAFSRAELYLPILFVEPILLVITVSHAYPGADTICNFLFHWTLRQILARTSRPEDRPLYLYLRDLVPPESHVLNALGQKRVGLFSLSDRWETVCLNQIERGALDNFAILNLKKAIEFPGRLFHQFFSK